MALIVEGSASCPVRRDDGQPGEAENTCRVPVFDYDINSKALLDTWHVSVCSARCCLF